MKLDTTFWGTEYSGVYTGCLIYSIYASLEIFFFMRLTYWILALICLIMIYYTDNIHEYLHNNLTVYSSNNANLMQVILAVLAGLFATRASDSSSELKRLLKLPEVDDKIKIAENAEERVRQLENIIKEESAKQFARDMLVSHRKRLIEHWEQIIELERLITEKLDNDFDPLVRREIRNYILKSKYIDYTGRGMLRNLPIIGGLADLILGPLWDTYHSRNIEKFDKKKR